MRGATAQEVAWEAGDRVRGRRGPRGELSPQLREAAEIWKPWLFRGQLLRAALARQSCVTLARSLFSLSRGCLICQVGLEGPAQSVLQRSVWMCTSFEKVERRH